MSGIDIAGGRLGDGGRKGVLWRRRRSGFRFGGLSRSRCRRCSRSLAGSLPGRRFLPALARIAVDSNEAGRMPLSGMDKEGAAIDLDQMEPLLRGKGQILEMLHAARRMEPAGNAAAVALDHPHQRKQQHQECHDDDNLL